MIIKPKIQNLFWIISMIILIIYVGYNYKNFQNEKRKVLNDHSFTIGKLIDYDIIGDIRTHYLTYSYYVDSIEYTERIVNPKRQFKKCVEIIQYCDKFRFIVMYSNKDPDLSLIDLTMEVSNEENIVYPTNFDNFQ